MVNKKKIIIDKNIEQIKNCNSKDNIKHFYKKETLLYTIKKIDKPVKNEKMRDLKKVIIHLKCLIEFIA